MEGELGTETVRPSIAVMGANLRMFLAAICRQIYTVLLNLA